MSKHPHEAPRHPLTFVQWIRIVGGIALATWLGLWFYQAGGRPISPMWPAAGVGLAYFVHFGRRAAVPVIVGYTVIWTVLYPGTYWPVVLMPVTYAFECWLGAWVGYQNRRVSAARRSAMWPTAWSYLGAPFLCTMPTAVVTTLCFTIQGKFTPEMAGGAFLLIVVAHAHGIMAFGALTLHVLQMDFNLADLTRSWKGLLSGVMALLVMVLAFTGTFDRVVSPNSAIFLPFPFLIMAAIWLQPAPAAGLLAIWCAGTTALVCLGHGPLVANSGGSVKPVELALYNMVMASVTYLVSVGSSQLLRQLNLNQLALSGAGIELWEWDTAGGFSWIQEREGEARLRDTTRRWHCDEMLPRLAGTSAFAPGIPDTWQVRLRGGDPLAVDSPAFSLMSVGRVLQRGLGDRPKKAIGLLQDISAMEKAEEALVALGYQKAKLRSLQAKLTPHFLFNSLNVIHALVHIDAQKADEAIASLARLLRWNLRANEASMISLRDELDHIREMLHLAKLRFGGRLQTRIRVPAELLDLPVPPMLLLNLVENAITHGIGACEEGGVVSIVVKVVEERIVVSIVNPGKLPESAVRGIGTQDALQRLEMLYGGRAGFSVSQEGDCKVVACVTLPLPPEFSL